MEESSAGTSVQAENSTVSQVAGNDGNDNTDTTVVHSAGIVTIDRGSKAPRRSKGFLIKEIKSYFIKLLRTSFHPRHADITTIRGP